MPRQRTFNPEDALLRALELFVEKGYEHTSMEDIVAATGVSRYGLYSAFGAKQELFKTALGAYVERGREQLIAPLQVENADLRTIVVYFGRLKENSEKPEGQRGCLVHRVRMEGGELRDEIGAEADAMHLEVEGLFLTILERAAEKGQLVEGADIEQLAAALTGLIQAGGSMVRLPESRERLFAMADSLLRGMAKQGRDGE